jgi:hypothetical protein
MLFRCLSVLLSFHLVADISSEQIDGEVVKVRRNQRICGPSSVGFCVRRLGYDVPVERILEQAPATDNGVSVRELVDLARRFGMRAKAVTVTNRDLRSLPVPSILVLRGNHCVVFDGFDESPAPIRVFEPAHGLMENRLVAQIDRDWNGDAIVFFDAPAPSWIWIALGAIVVTACSCAAILLRIYRRDASTSRGLGACER